jgi:hypothetical protein
MQLGVVDTRNHALARSGCSDVEKPKPNCQRSALHRKCQTRAGRGHRKPIRGRHNELAWGWCTCSCVEKVVHPSTIRGTGTRFCCECG